MTRRRAPGVLRRARASLEAGSRFGRRLAVLACLLVLPLSGTGCGRAPDHAAMLRAFLIDGPGSGTWEVQGIAAKRTTWIAPHPADGAWLLKAEAKAGGDARPCVALRSTVAREFLEGPWDLFTRNYVLVGPAQEERTRDGTPALHLKWVPRVQARDTARHVWFDVESGEVLQIEDVAREGQVVRGIYRTSTSTGELDPKRVLPGGASGQDICMQAESESISMQALLAVVPFPLVAPAWVPAGYARIGARFEELPVRGADQEPVRLVSLLYSDGLGLISVGIALPPDMDALQARLAQMDPADPAEGGCATLPPEAGQIALARERVLRRRTDRCRTVLRLDDVDGVSVTLLSRNELPGDEYVKLMESLQRVTTP
jgi:hypothetical protein